MFSLPKLGGSELIAALKRLGFRVASSGGGATTMFRQSDGIVVPETAMLSPALVGAMLRAAEVDPLDFLQVVDEVARRNRQPSTTRLD